MKNLDSYIFTSESNNHQMLRRETITRNVNRLMRSVSKSLPDQPRITRHSFQVRYISRLWKDTKDIEFVRQGIGHAKIDTTSQYVENLFEKERQDQMLKISG
jgi:site-specific recombinase XerD